MRHNLGLSASALIGVLAILTVAVCVPIFSDAVSGDVLRKQLDEIRAQTQRNLFSLRYKYQERSNTSLLDYDKSQTIADFLKSQIPAELGVPVNQIVMDIYSGGLVVTDMTGRWPEGKSSPMGRWPFLVQELLPQHGKIVEGKWPEPDNGRSGPIQVAVPVAMADEMLLKIGDHFLLENLEIEIVGFWSVENTNDPIWFTNPNSTYARTLWIPLTTFLNRVAPVDPQPIDQVSWYAIINDQDLKFQNAAQYLRGLVRLDAELTKRVDGIKNISTPMEALLAYDRRAQTLMTMFYVVGAPMVVLALIFIGLTARISVQQVENETAILRARGTSRAEVMLLNLVESLILFLIAIPLSLLLGWLAANVMNQTLSFLQFTNRPIFAISFSGLNLPIMAAAIAVIVAARFTPVISGSRITVLRVKHEQSRGSQKPFWERFYLDFFLLLPGLYAFFVLKGWAQQGTPPTQLLSKSQLATVQQFRDPLLFVAPALFAIALSLVVVRFIPLIVRLMAAIASRMRGVWAYLSLQQIARRSQDHSSALLLIIIALGLSIFTVSTARTLDRWLFDSEYYKVGADLAVREFIATSSGGGGEFGPSQTVLIESFLPIEDHLKVQGIQGVTRVGKYDGEFSFGRGNISSKIMGIDRIDFPSAAYFRDDFSSDDMGTLMNDLGLNLEGVLVPTSLMTENGVALGDQLAVSINAGGNTYNRDFIVVGSYDYFPTVFPGDKPTLIVNLDSIFNYPEDVGDYQMWLKLKPDADPQAVTAEIADRIGPNVGLVVVEGNALQAVLEGQDKPERMGLFGILNVGFFVTGLMPGIGFLIYSYAALRRRFIQLGILQAIGLSVKQLIAALVSEQVILMGLAILSGAAIGLLTSLMFVPFLQTGATPGAPVPPFQVLIGWTEAGWLSLAFGLILSLTMVGTIFYLVRLKVFQAVKLGETV